MRFTFSRRHPDIKSVARVQSLGRGPRAILTNLDLRIPMRLFAAGQRLRFIWERDHQVARANRILADIASEVAGHAWEKGWQGQKVLSTVTDVTVVTLGQAGRPPEALLKLANSETAAADLKNQSRVLAALRADARLHNWSALLPDVCREGQVGHQYYVIEILVPGVDARMVLRHPGARSRMLAAAAETIGELHTRTATIRPVDAGLLNQWIDRRVEIIRPSLMHGTEQDRYTEKLEGLAGELHRSVAGQKVPVGWIHGDFGPGNLLVSPDGKVVTGVVDWGLASPADLPFLDLVHMLLSTRMYMQRRELGDIIRRLLDRGDWTEEEIGLLESEQKMFSSQTLDMRSLLLLAWLRHVASNLSKSPHYAHNWLWINQNVKGVLAAL